MKLNKPENIIVHHTATARDSTTFDAVNRYHKKKWNFKSALGYYIGYQYFISGRGNITQGRLNTEGGAHTKQKGMNFKSVGICLAGNFDNEQPTKIQVEQLTKLMFQLHTVYGIAPENVYPHRAFAPKSCYGSSLPDTWAESLLARRIAREKAEDDENTRPERARKLIALLQEAGEIARTL